MTHDGMTSKEKDVYERYVIKCLQEAGIEDTNSATVLQTLDKDAFSRAIGQMKDDTDFRFKPESTTTVAQLAEGDLASITVDVRYDRVGHIT